MMKARDVFIKHDERRGKWSVQPMGWLVAVLALILVATSTVGVWRSLAGPQLRVTPTVPPTATLRAAEAATPTQPPPTATPVVYEACPSNPALWKLVSYTLPGSEREFLMIDPPCVMEQVEKTYAEYVDARAEKGPDWTIEDDERFFTSETVVTPLKGETLNAYAPGHWKMCYDVVKEDGSLLTSADYHVVFYTMSEEGLVADLLVIVGGFPATSRFYDCETDEVVSEDHVTDVAVSYQPMVYDPMHKRWQLAWGVDSFEHVDPGEIDQPGMANMVLWAQGRATR
jgi:hypothetical protein